MDDEWQLVESPNDSNEEPADPHMSTPKPSPSPTPQSTIQETTLSDENNEEEKPQEVEKDQNSDDEKEVEQVPSPETTSPVVTAGNKKRT